MGALATSWGLGLVAPALDAQADVRRVHRGRKFRGHSCDAVYTPATQPSLQMSALCIWAGGAGS